MFKDVVNLILVDDISDGAGGYQRGVKSDRQVFAHKKSVRQSEFYLASQADLQAEVVFKISLVDYQDERIIMHENKCYSVIRTYEVGDFIELTCQKRIGGLDEVLK